MTLKVTKRLDAIASGETRYFSGQPCSRGHIAERNVAARECIECCNIRAGGYNERRRLLSRAPCPRGHVSGKYTRSGKCAECAIKDGFTVDKIRDRKAYNSQLRDAYAANPFPILARCSARRACKRAAEGFWEAADIARIMLAQRGICASPACMRSVKKVNHIDHIMPLSLGGSNWPKNLQLLCPPCNRGKYNKHPIIWARERGVLL